MHMKTATRYLYAIRWSSSGAKAPRIEAMNKLKDKIILITGIGKENGFQIRVRNKVRML